MDRNTFIQDSYRIIQDLQRKYPHLSVEQLEGGVVSTLEKLTNEAIEKRKDFAFETNFSSDMATNITKKFKENNFTANLIYIGIDSLNDCKSRVTERIALGGHNVSDSQIEFNYHEGIKRVAENLSLFDNITFVDNMNIGKLKIVALSKKGFFKSILDENCNWFTCGSIVISNLYLKIWIYHNQKSAQRDLIYKNS